MTDREWLYLTGVIAALAVLWYFARKANAPMADNATPAESEGGMPIPWDEPMQQVYAANPEAFYPPSNADLTLNIGNQLANLLSNEYTPLFGFMGVAQGIGY